jgi:hypothetical protein
MSLRELLGFKPRMKDLAKRMLDHFEREGSHGWHYDAAQSTLKNASVGTINLANIYLEYAQAARAQRPILLQKYLGMSRASMQEIPKLWTLAAKGIHAVLRSRFDHSVLAIDARAGGNDIPEMVSWPWLGDLHIRLVYDFGEQLAMVSRESMEVWGQAPQAVLQRAIQNLRALPIAQWEALPGGVHQLRSEASYEESLLLVDKVIDQLPFKDSVVCIAVNRGILLAADARSGAAVAALIEEALRCLQSKPWPLSASLCTRVEGQWQEYRVDGAAASRAGDLARINLAITYEGQTAALEQFFEKTGEDIHVAKFGMMRNPAGDNALRSWCAWSEGVCALLPKTDLVVLGREGAGDAREAVLIDWLQMQELCGRHLRNTEENPQRYRVDSFPDAAEWAAVKCAGKPLSM